MSSREECGLYFKSQPEYRRIFKEMRKKWESLGRTAGRVTMANATGEERKALERFLGRAMEQGGIAFSLPEFEKALGETRYGQVSLKELLEEYFGEPMVGNQERRQQKKNREERFWEELEGEIRGTEGKGQLGAEGCGEDKAAEKDVSGEIISWIREMREQKSQGYGVVMKEYQKSPESAKERIREIARKHASSCQGRKGRRDTGGRESGWLSWRQKLREIPTPWIVRLLRELSCLMFCAGVTEVHFRRMPDSGKSCMRRTEYGLMNCPAQWLHLVFI